MITGLIPWDSMDRWCERHHLDDAAADVLIEALCYADALDFKERSKAVAPTPQAKGSRQ